jgi:hypothetical protein
MGMVFSVNAIATGPNNFAAFQALAIQENGTASATLGTSAPSQTKSGASTLSPSHAAGVVVAIFAIIVSVMA